MQPKTETSSRPVTPWSRTLGGPARLTSGYGMRKDPFTGRPAFHHGIDLAAPRGTSIYPFEGGTVKFNGWKSGYGRVVVVEHDNGLESFYGHTSKNLVPVGTRVDRDTPIAEVGSTGRSTGAHLHFEVRREGKAVNPLPYLQQSPMQTASL
jgi:murein DD-endopeptidase MepM/ murein hydrolase activator NlpD